MFSYIFCEWNSKKFSLKVFVLGKNSDDHFGSKVWFQNSSLSFFFFLFSFFLFSLFCIMLRLFCNMWRVTAPHVVSSQTKQRWWWRGDFWALPWRHLNSIYSYFRHLVVLNLIPSSLSSKLSYPEYWRAISTEDTDGIIIPLLLNKLKRGWTARHPSVMGKPKCICLGVKICYK